MANNFTKIQTVTVAGSSAAAIEFTSIPSTYTDLYLTGTLRTTTTGTPARGEINLKFNNSTSGYYRSRGYAFDAAIAQKAVDQASSQSVAALASAPNNSATSNTFGPLTVYILNYANTSYYKSFFVNMSAENNSATDWVLAYGNFRWDNTSAINSITVYPTVDALKQYSSLTLYGIKNS